MFKKSALFLLFIISTFSLFEFFSTSVYSAPNGAYQKGDKYTFKERVGVAGSIPKDLLFDVGWGYSWNYPYSQRARLTPYEYIPLLTFGTSTLDIPLNDMSLRLDSTCSKILADLKAATEANPLLYPSGTKWLLGNEIGWDTTDSAETAAKRFVYTRACLELFAKDKNRKFYYGTGALISIWHLLPKPSASPYCVNNYLYNSTEYLTNQNSGYNYFKTYLSTLISKYSIRPDFVAYHDYTCHLEDFTDREFLRNSAHSTSIYAIRKMMKDFGLQSTDLYITEFAPLFTLDAKEIQNNLDFAFKYYASTKDTTYGNPSDNFRMVQRWAWFIGSIGPTSSDFSSYARFSLRANLSDSEYKLNTLSPLGVLYKNLTQIYSVSDPVNTDFDANGVVNIADLHHMLIYLFSTIPEPRFLPNKFDLNKDGFVNVKDVVVFVRALVQ